jgi:ATP-dependent helicase HrpB
MVLVASAWGVEELGVACAALIEARDVVLVARELSEGYAHPGRRAAPVAASRSDLEDRIELVQYAQRQGFSPRLGEAGIDVAAARQVVLAQADLTRVLRRLRSGSGVPIPACPVADPGRQAIEILPLLAYPDRVCRRRATDPLTGVMVGGRGVRLDPSSRVRQGELFLAIRLRDDSRRARSRGEARVQIAGAIEPEWLAALSPTAVTEDRAVRFDRERGRAVAVVTIRYFDLAIREETHGAVDRETASASLAAALSDEAESIVRADPEAARWLDRLDFLRGLVPSLPELGAEALAEILNQACTGVVTIKDLRARSMVPFLLAKLGSTAVRTLNELAPEFLVVPSGSRIPVLYQAGQPPTLAVRIQELFGWHETPRIAGGSYPLLLHLLGPNYRPVQVTCDLRSFWTTTYLQVRKDLRGRYPKHHWPEDPWTARPASRPKRPGAK